MNEGGYYDGWSHYAVIIKPSLQFGMAMRVTMSGKDRKYDQRDYIFELLDHALSCEYDMESLYGDE